MPQTITLSALDQITVRMNINVLFCFSLTSPNSQISIIKHLQRGLSSFAREFPFVKGHVRPLPDHGHVQVVYDNESPDPPMFTQTIPEISYDQLKESGLIIHGQEYVGLTLETWDCDNAVFAVKTSFLNGGMVLCVTIHHSVVDAKGFEMLAEIFAAYCAGIGGSIRESGILHDRCRLLQGANYEESLQYHGRICVPDPSAESVATIMAEATPKIAVLFEFSNEALVNLRNTLMEHIERPISRLDAVTATIIASITQAQLESLPLDTICAINVAVDGRSKMSPKMPEHYIGNVVAGACVLSSVGTIVSSNPKEAAAKLACRIRNSIENVDGALFRRYITMIEAEPDIRRAWLRVPSEKPVLSFMCSSWERLSFNSIDFCGHNGPSALKILDGVRVFTGSAEPLIAQPRAMSKHEDGNSIIAGPLTISTLLDKAVFEILRKDEFLSAWCKLRSTNLD